MDEANGQLWQYADDLPKVFVFYYQVVAEKIQILSI